MTYTDNAHPLLASGRYDWRTPEWFLDLVRRVGTIELDPCTTKDNPIGARVIYTQALAEDNTHIRCGLSCDWRTVRGNGLAYINPPYGPHLSGPVEPGYWHWRGDTLIGVGRGWAEKIASYNGNAIALVPVRTETKWWRRMYDACDACLLWSSEEHGSRISFVNADTGEPMLGSNLASTVFCYGRGSMPEIFRQVFSSHGTIIK